MGFTEIPAPPELRGSDVRVWTGTELIVWGGNANGGEPPHHADGWAFDPTTSAWRKLPPSPLSPRSWAAGVWTGSELVVWGGSDGRWPGEGLLGDGAAFDPSSDSWRMLPPAPLDPVAPAVAAWTGDEILLWGSIADEGPPSGAAYDPASDTWRDLPDAPDELVQSVTGAWTGSELVVIGGHGRPNEYEAAAIAYAPETDAWRSLPPPGLDDNLVALTPVGSTVAAVDTYRRVSLFDVASGAWRPMPQASTDTCEGFTAIAASSDTIVVAICGDLVSLAPGAPRWHTPADELPLIDVYASAGDVVLASVYGSSGNDPERLFAFRPPGYDPGVTVDDARDLATAFAALRSHYPYGDGELPDGIDAQIRAMLSSSGAAAWEVQGMAPLWAYYPGHDVVSVEGPVAGTGDTFEARIRLTGYDGLDVTEVIVMAPGADLDGTVRDLVIVDARPAGSADYPQP